MAEDRVRMEREGQLALLTLDRESRRNALDERGWHALRDAAAALAQDAPRVALITGAGGHFCSGLDLSLGNPLFARVAQAVGESDEAVRAIVEELKAVLNAVADLPCPTVAAIEGACAGSGLELALACDLRVAAEGSSFSLPETRFGMVPDVGGTVRLARLVGRARATDLILTSRRIEAEEALRWGLVDRLVPAGGALDAARALAEEIVGCAPTATRQVLAVLRAVDGLEDGEAFRRETGAGVRALRSGEVMEGIRSFAQKRPPRWS